MKKNKFTIRAHPLTIVFGCVLLLFEKPLELLTYVVVVISHEWLHYLAASWFSVPLDDVVITPFGGCLKGEFLGVSPKITLVITLVAPIANLIISACIFALWWLFPSVYPYTETLAYANLSVGAVNLLPCYPLDGGRAALALFPESERFSKGVIKLFSIAVSVFSLFLFVLSAFSKSANLSYLTMAVFLLFGAFYEEKKDYVAKKCRRLLKKKEKKFLPVECVMANSSEEYEMLAFLSGDRYVLFIEEKDGKIVGVTTEDEFLKRIKNK